MKIVKMTLILIFSLMVCISNVYAYDFGTNVTINDNRSNTGINNDGYSYTTPQEHGWWTTGKGQGGEDQEVEPGMWPLQKWDLEGFFLKGNSLSMVGGFDFKNGVEGIRSGSIFIDVNGDAQYGSFSGTTLKNYGYEYAIDLNFGTSTNTYKVYDNSSSWLLAPVIESQNRPASNPWRHESGGAVVASGSFAYLASLSDNDVGFLGDYNGIPSHYAVTGFDLAFLPAGKTFIAHFTEECGNDNLMDDGKTTVPEPATMLLLSLGLMGITVIKRKVKALN